jgi:hypothetical protein
MGLMMALAFAHTARAGNPLVAELFTSQGCSSCPPADALLGELAQEQDLIALAFHVQYWDGLGWADHFGLPEAARRQAAYVQRLHQLSGFTPQLILNAKRSVVGSDRAQIRSTIDALRGVTTSSVAITVNKRDGVVSIALPEYAHTIDQTEVLLLPVLSQDDTVIGRGENGGRTLREFNIVRAVKLLGQWQGAAAHFEVPLASMPKDADRVAVLVQELRQGAIRGAALVTLR